MPRLIATFTVPLGAPILLRGSDRPRKYSVLIGTFDVTLTLTPIRGARSKSKNERLWTLMCRELVVSVSRDEATPPPSITRTPEGGRDRTQLSSYLTQLFPEYERAAYQALQNVLLFLRYKLRQPLSTALQGSTQGLSNPAWSDEGGNEIDRGGRISVVSRVPGIWNEFGVVKLEHKHDKSLRAAMTAPQTPSLHVEILSDAQAAAFDGNMRRAVLELAIACEVYAKHVFFGGDSGAQVFDALEDRGRVNVRVIELIEIGSMARFGKSFRTAERNAYMDIDHLFRSRNKIAHRGEPVYRDDKGVLHKVDAKLLGKWWRSVETLFNWAG